MSTNLQGFLDKFSSPTANYAETIDPEATFDVKMKFLPFLPPKDKKKNDRNTWDKFKDAAGKAGSAAKSAVGSISGGLLDLDNLPWNDDPSVKQEKENFKDHGKMTNIAYIAKGNGFTKDEYGTQFAMDISYYVQNIQLPQITNDSNYTSDTILGQFIIPNKLVKPSSNTFQMTIVNTKAPLLERLFYPWMREVTLPFWVYDTQPYTTADISIRFKKHMDLEYLFVGCRPTNIQLITPQNELPSTPVRQVTMTFNYMIVKSKLKYKESAKKTFQNLGKAALSDGGSMLGF